MTVPGPVLLPDPTIQQWLDRLAAAQPADVLKRLAALEAQQTTTTVALAALTQMIIDTKEGLMATAEEFAARLDTATNEIASDLQALRDQLQAVRDEIPAAQRAAVDEALAKLDAPIARLEALGQDPQNPVPTDPNTPAPIDPNAPDQPTPGEPEPAPGGGTEVLNPTPNPDQPA